MHLIAQYDLAVQQKQIQADVQQREVVIHFQQLWDELHRPKHFFLFWKKLRGIYLYGPVGGGKTFLMDLFYHALPTSMSARFHFHQFMQSIDEQLRQLQGKENPIQHIAKKLASRVKVLCLDEFIVQDITQASVLVELLSGLFQRGVIIIATSNTAPDQLYLNGMNRERFLPAIALLHQYCEVLALSGQKDYRIGHLSSPVTYVTPLGDASEQTLLQVFHEHASCAQERGEICVQRRNIPFLRCGEHAIWFEFQVLCQIPRCQLDYLELAEKFSSFFVSNIPVLKPEDTVAVLLLMYLVDVLYDKRRRLVISAAASVDELYPAGPMHGEFERTKSRLAEMQSVDYLYS
jgi:cell division protein ZapE